MRKYVKKTVCLIFVLLLLVSMFPFAAFADPVSAAAIANGFAQAITAYGASNGVSICFDGVNSSNTSQIGENLHELWKKFREDEQGVDDYAELAEMAFPGLYNKVYNATGQACVAVGLIASVVDDVDQFWNWLLTGPAEMVKVDNQFQWNYDAQGNIITPQVYQVSTLSGYNVVKFPISCTYNSNGKEYLERAVPIDGQENYLIYAMSCNGSSTSSVITFFVSENASSYKLITYRKSNGEYQQTQEVTQTLSRQIPGTTWHYTSGGNSHFVSTLPYNNATSTEIRDTLSTRIQNNTLVAEEDSLTLKPASTADPTIDIPDVTDPDYGPIPYYGPLNVPWNDTLFGPGTGALEGFESEAIADAIDGAIVGDRDKTIPLATDRVIDPDRPESDDTVSQDPDNYAVLGLDDVFPFCIPFDIYDFLSALAADPVAPHFTAELEFPEAVGGTKTIDLDFDTPVFNQLAQLLRLLELLAFIVGLALLTRSMFIRG